MEDKTIRSRQTNEQREDIPSPSPPPPQTAHATDASNNNEDVTECPQRLPYDLNVMKEFIQPNKDDNYIPLMSAITLKKRKKMLFIPLEFQKIKIDALVDSGAYIKVISEQDAAKSQKEANASIIEKAPPPTFKMHYATIELENAFATYTLKFKIGDYTFKETFIIMTKTSYPVIGVAFLQRHYTIVDTAQGTIDFPKIQITLALTN